MYSVGKGSSNEPYLICLKYNGNPSQPENVLALVGKGVCFDSGGLSLKTALTEIMHMDKGGACTVFGALKGAVDMKLKVSSFSSIEWLLEKYIIIYIYRERRREILS